ncbi:MAG: hypothetical protein IJG35_05875 [Bacteroidales bacterium]|nr:hypothetical protein [Bacteroidales bacterium]
MKRFWLVVMVMLACGCSRTERLRVSVSDAVLQSSYLGNGVEWDPYDEAPGWGVEVSDADWKKLTARMDFLRPGFIRCMIGGQNLYYDHGTYDRERNAEPLLKLLAYCQERGIEVLFGEFNPPDKSLKADPAWVKMSVDYLDWLVQEKGFDCIRHFIIFNEPDGDWATPEGDYAFWKFMMERFHQEMALHPGLLDKVSLAGPDVVVEYRNPASAYDAPGWVAQTAADLDSLVGLYDIHAYPGQQQVRSGAFADLLQEYRIPEGKRLVLGEAGYKYWREEDAALQAENDRRAAASPYTQGTDSQMLCGDFFYGLDLSVLAMDVMNGGVSGMAVWMLDDALHAGGDSPRNLKVWGFWNILGEELFGDPSLETPKPSFYGWALMSRFVPAGCDILRVEAPPAEGLRMAAAVLDGRHTLAVVNFSDTDRNLEVHLPLSGAVRYEYVEGVCPADADGMPVPVSTGIGGKRHEVAVPAQSLVLLTDMP